MMIYDLLQIIIDEITVMGVQLRMQATVSPTEKQKHPILGTLDLKGLDGAVIGEILRTELEKLENIPKTGNIIRCLSIIANNWNKQRISAQYDGYYDDNKSKAYAYLLLLKVIKKHKKLFKLLQNK